MLFIKTKHMRVCSDVEKMVVFLHQAPHQILGICYITFIVLYNYIASVLSAELLHNRGLPRKFQNDFNLLVLTRSASSLIPQIFSKLCHFQGLS